MAYNRAQLSHELKLMVEYIYYYSLFRVVASCSPCPFLMLWNTWEKKVASAVSGGGTILRTIEMIPLSKPGFSRVQAPVWSIVGESSTCVVFTLLKVPTVSSCRLKVVSPSEHGTQFILTIAPRVDLQSMRGQMLHAILWRVQSARVQSSDMILIIDAEPKSSARSLVLWPKR
jgi:hypothetical protein